MFFQELWQLLKKDLKVELRRKTSISGVLLYLVSSIFVLYFTFTGAANSIGAATWSALFWILMLFGAMNAMATSFYETGERNQYYYCVASPTTIILAKAVYNILLMLLLAAIGYAFYILLMGNKVESSAVFVLAVFLASAGFSTFLTLVSAISAKSSRSPFLIAVLGFPTIIPMIMLVIKISKNAIAGLALENSMKEVLVLVAINIISLTLSYLLFPYLWRS